MGTSSIYDGPLDRNPLLPDDFEDTDNKEKPDHKKDEPRKDKPTDPFVNPWKTAKTSMTRHLTGSSPNRNGAVRNYMRASGGSAGFVRSASSGISSGARIGNFVTSIQQKGLQATLSDFHINMVGKSSEELFSELVNALSDSPDTKEDSAAREAVTTALMELYKYLDDNKIEFNKLDSLDNNLVDRIMSSYIASYIWARISNDMHSRFEKYLNDPKSAAYKENDFKLYIKNCVDVELNKNSFVNRNSESKTMDKTINDLLQKCCDVLGGIL